MPGKKVILRYSRINNSKIEDIVKQRIIYYGYEPIIEYFNHNHGVMPEEIDDLDFNVRTVREGKNGNKLLVTFELPDNKLSEDFDCENFKEWANRVEPPEEDSRFSLILAIITTNNLNELVRTFYPLESRLICSSCNIEEVIQAGGRKTCGGKRLSSKKTTTRRTQTKRRTNSGKRRSS